MQLKPLKPGVGTRSNQQKTDGVWHQPYVEFTDEVELWIQCDICLAWCHFVCVGLDPRDQPQDNFVINAKSKF